MNEKMDSDLDWLVRNVHEWSGGNRCVSVLGGVIRWTVAYLPCDGLTWFTKDQWLARRAELQGKPNWADAPEWAKFLIQTMAGWWLWLSDEPCDMDDLGIMTFRTDAKSEKAAEGERLGDWRDTLERRRPDMHKSEPEIDTPAERVQRSAESIHNLVCSACGCKGIHACLGRKATHADTLQEITEFVAKQQAKEASDWFERGELPPVGVKCEMFSVDDWEPVFIVGYSADGYMVVEMECEFITATQANKFRPIRPERNELIEIILSCNMSEGVLADAILAAGFKRGAE